MKGIIPFIACGFNLGLFLGLSERLPMNILLISPLFAIICFLLGISLEFQEI